MKLGIDATVLEDAKPTGVGNFTINTVNNLTRIHQDILVWTLEDSFLKIDDINKRQVLSLSKKIMNNKVYVSRALWTQWSLPKQLCKEKIDVFYTPIAEGIINSPIPQIVTVHDITPLKYKELVPRLRYYSYKYRLPRILRSSQKIVAVSRQVKADIIEYYGVSPEKIEVVYEGYDSANYRLLDTSQIDSVINKYSLSRGRYYLYIGSIFRTKNLETLIAAFSKINGDCKLVLAGKKLDVKYYNYLHELINKKSIKNIVFLDYVPYKELPYLYAGTLALVLVSLYEGFGLPCLEAMACGAPVIASGRGSLPEIVGNAGLLVNPLDCDDIVVAMKSIADDGALRQQIIEKGFERVREFSWEKTSEQILEVCESVC